MLALCRGANSRGKGISSQPRNRTPSLFTGRASATTGLHLKFSTNSCLALVICLCLVSACATQPKIAPLTPKTARPEVTRTLPAAPPAISPNHATEREVPDITRKTIQAPDEIRKQSGPTADAPDTRLAARIIVGADANPYFVRSENRERASPIAIRFYQLRSFAAFENATFSSIFEDEQHALGESLLSREEFQLMPGETHKFNRNLSKDTRYIGVLAAFRKIERAQWRAHIAIDSINSTELLVLINGTTVQLNGH